MDRVTMNVLSRVIFLGVLLFNYHAQGAQAAARDAIQQLEALLRKPADTLRDTDKRAVNRLLQGLSRTSDSFFRQQADRLSTLWEIKMAEQRCVQDERNLKAVLGEGNYAKAMKGEDIDPRDINEASLVGLHPLLENDATLQNLFETLRVSTLEDALTKVEEYKKKIAISGKQPEAIKADADRLTALSLEEEDLQRQIDAKNQEYDNKQESINQMSAALASSNEPCAKKDAVSNELYSGALGEDNWKELKNAVDMLLEKSQGSANGLMSILTLDRFPANSLVRKEVEESLNQQKQELARLQTEIQTKEIELAELPGCADIEIKVRMVLNYYQNRERWGLLWNNSIPLIDNYVVKIIKGEPLSAEEEQHLKPYLNDAVIAALSGCAKKIKQLEAIIGYYKTGQNNQFFDSYFVPIFTDAGWSDDIKKNIRLYNREAVGIGDPDEGFDRNKNDYQVTKEEYEQIFGK